MEDIELYDEACALGDDSEEFLRYSTAASRGSSGAPGTAGEAACMSDEAARALQ